MRDGNMNRVIIATAYLASLFLLLYLGMQAIPAQRSFQSSYQQSFEWGQQQLLQPGVNNSIVTVSY